MAERAIFEQSAHERLCSERYNNINNQLTNMPTIFGDIKDLKVELAKIGSMHRSLVIMSLAMGIIYTILKITGHA